VLIEQQATRAIAALRRQQFDATPIGSMLKQWRDGSNNLQQASTGWMNNFNDRLTDLVMKGQTNWRSLTQTILQDLIKISLQVTESKLFSSILGLGGLNVGGGATGGADGLAAIHHTGGVAGASMPYRQVSMSMFSSALRYHTGGTVGLGPDEVPIIAKQGEEVGWPSQMAAKYGGGGGQHVSFGDININGGSPGQTNAQHREFAKIMQGQLREMAGQMIGDELRKQTRPGGLLKG
jgi:lambda family phage tail tape measure protein